MALLPGRYDLLVIQGMTQVEKFRMEEDDGTVIDTFGWLARCQIRSNPDGAQVVHWSTSTGHVQVGYDPPKWNNATVYVVGEYLVPPTPNGLIYQITDAGTSGASQPAWPLVIGTDVTLDGVTYEAVLSDDEALSNLRLAIVPGDTSDLVDWGFGYWDLEVIDDFSGVYRVLEGNAFLSREITQEA